MTSRRQFLRTSLGAGAALAAGWSSGKAAEGAMKRTVQRGKALGTEVTITVLHDDNGLAKQGVEAAFAELRLVEQLMSIYRADSQLSELNRQRVVHKPHPYLREVLRCSERVSRSSHGAFDITVQPLWKLYADAKRNKSTPDADQVALAAKQIDWRGVRCDRSRVAIRKPAHSITLNGVAQGYAADRAKAALVAAGVQHALIDTGELAPLGQAASGRAWSVGVQHPRRADAFAALVNLGTRSLATSGDYATTFSEDRQHNHLFDPKTGRSPQTFSSVSVVARNAMEADALSTALFAMDLESGLRMLGAFQEADALLIQKNGRTMMTKGFPRRPS